MDLTGRAAIVTGSSSGIGRAAAVRLARAGARVCLNSLPGDGRGGEFEKHLRDSGCDCFLRPADVTNQSEVKALVDHVLARWGKIDILVNNAGISGAGPTFLTITGDDWDRMLTTNAKSVFLVTQVVLPHMIAAHYGKIVNLSSTAGIASLVTSNAYYAASKGAIVAFTRRMARDCAPHGINVNCVAPGLIHDTGFNEKMNPETLAACVAQIPLGRPGYVKDVSGIIAFLCSEEADFITGQVVVVDGGATC